MYNENAWKKYDEKELKDLFKFNDEYIEFISNNKTEREVTKATVEILKKNGYKNLDDVTSLKAGDKIYAVNRGKNVAAFIIGKEDIEKGINVLGAHIDSPRIDLKQNPLYESSDFAYFDTHYYGGIVKYQWVARPLAIHGVVCKKDGSIVDVVIGEDDNDPVVMISDLLPHLAQDKNVKPGTKVIEGEDLDLTIGHMPLKDEEKDAVKANVLKLLKDKYGIEENDFVSSELEIVPQGKARSLGLDSSMVLGYGHDDRVCAYTSLRAVLDTESVKRTSCAVLVDKEEIGSVGATGAQSKWFTNVIAEIINKMKNNYNDLMLQHTLTNSYMLSSDVSAAFDPLYPSVFEKKNAAYLGHGLTFNKYTGARGKSGCNDASPEFIAKIRNIMDNANVSYQTAELGRVDQGGGGTIAYILSNQNMNVIDAGIPVISMHAPCETVSKVDVYEAYKGYIEFIKNIA
ncbi:MAG: aminopeptidase [Acholeplasmatales bacterium]|nr:aminopeptidase [Acholeplasmatales bacterium]